jgi:hypothetical protein
MNAGDGTATGIRLLRWLSTLPRGRGGCPWLPDPPDRPIWRDDHVTRSSCGGPAGLTSGSSRVWLVGSWLLVAAVLSQRLQAGLGNFVSSAFFEWHGSVGSGAAGLFALVVLSPAALGRVPGAVRTGTEIVARTPWKRRSPAVQIPPRNAQPEGRAPRRDLRELPPRSLAAAG